MKKALVAVALAGMLAAVAACGGSSSTPTSAGPGSADRDKFVGTWNGTHGCDFTEKYAATMIVEAGSGDRDVTITLYLGFDNPPPRENGEKMNGTLTSATEIDVPEQSVGGAPGTVKLKLNGDTLEFTAVGRGFTCSGTDYKKE